MCIRDRFVAYQILHVTLLITRQLQRPPIPYFEGQTPKVNCGRPHARAKTSRRLPTSQTLPYTYCHRQLLTGKTWLLFTVSGGRENPDAYRRFGTMPSAIAF